jgi:hypothetical protein
MLQKAAQEIGAELILIDAGSNLSAISRATLIAAQHIILPLAPSLFSLHALRSLGPVLRNWRKDWQKYLDKLSADNTTTFPNDPMQILGYIVIRHGAYESRLVINYKSWFYKIPEIYYDAVMAEPENKLITVNEDPYNLFVLEYHDVLLPLAIEAHKPMFALKTADEVFGTLIYVVNKCLIDFRKIVRRINAAANFVIEDVIT